MAEKKQKGLDIDYADIASQVGEWMLVPENRQKVLDGFNAFLGFFRSKPRGKKQSIRGSGKTSLIPVVAAIAMQLVADEKKRAARKSKPKR